MVCITALKIPLVYTSIRVGAAIAVVWLQAKCFLRKVDVVRDHPSRGRGIVEIVRYLMTRGKRDGE
jgi:hypothetical protein